MGKKNRYQRSGSTSGSTTSAPTPKTGGSSFRAPTSGYEDVIFSFGSAKDAATFEEVRVKLSRYVTVQSWRGATVAGTAMEDMMEPDLPAPVRPSKKMITMITTIKSESGQDISKEEDVSDEDYKLERELYVIDIKE